jgi:uncharacterized protein (DUF1697 family)
VTAVISMLRGVNVGGNNMIKMEALCALYASLGLRDPQSYIQSGNVVFRTDRKEIVPLAKKIEDAIEDKFGFRPPVVLRTAAELREVIAKNPFAKRAGIEPGKLLVSFLMSDPAAADRELVNKMKFDPEELHIGSRHLYIYFPTGQGKSKLNSKAIDKTLKTSGTGRNWNSVLKLLEMAESLEES